MLDNSRCTSERREWQTVFSEAITFFKHLHFHWKIKIIFHRQRADIGQQLLSLLGLYVCQHAICYLLAVKCRDS